MTIDDLKLQRDGHLAYGPTPASQRSGLRPLFEHIEWIRDAKGKVIGEVTTDGGRGAIEWGRRSA